MFSLVNTPTYQESSPRSGGGGGARCPGLVVDEAIRNFGSLF